MEPAVVVRIHPGQFNPRRHSAFFLVLPTLAELGDMEEAREAYSRGIEIANHRGHGGLVEELQEALDDLS